MLRRSFNRLLVGLLLVYLFGTFYFYKSADKANEELINAENLYHPVMQNVRHKQQKFNRKRADHRYTSAQRGYQVNFKHRPVQGNHLQENVFPKQILRVKENEGNRVTEKSEDLQRNIISIRKKRKHPRNALYTDNKMNIVITPNIVTLLKNLTSKYEIKTTIALGNMVNVTLLSYRQNRQMVKAAKTEQERSKFTSKIPSKLSLNHAAGKRKNIQNFHLNRSITLKYASSEPKIKRKDVIAQKELVPHLIAKPQNGKRMVDIFRDKETLLKEVKSKLKNKKGDRDSLKNLMEKIEETKLIIQKKNHFKKYKGVKVRPVKSKVKTINSAIPKIHTIDLRSYALTNQSKQQYNNILTQYNVNFAGIANDLWVYSTYLDERKSQKFIRVVMIGRGNNRIKRRRMFCKFQILNKKNETKISQINYYETCESHMRQYSAYIGSCEVPNDNVKIKETTLYLEDIETRVFTYINIINNNMEKPVENDFAVCVPPLFGNISPLRLAEFIEFSYILGANHFIFYLHNITRSVEQMLRYYERLGIVTLMPWDLPIASSHIWYYGQSVSVWDCLYRTMFKFKHVLFIDFDEILMPQKHLHWSDLLRYIKTVNNLNDDIISAYRFSSAFFAPDTKDGNSSSIISAEQLITLKSTLRTREFSKIRTKMMVDPGKIFELGIHHLSKPNEEHFEAYNVKSNEAFLNHYRTCEGDYAMDCKTTVRDVTAWRFKTRLLKKVNKRFTELRKLNNNTWS